MVEELGNETVRGKCVRRKLPPNFRGLQRSYKLLYWKFTSLICFYNELSLINYFVLKFKISFRPLFWDFEFWGKMELKDFPFNYVLKLSTKVSVAQIIRKTISWRIIVQNALNHYFLIAAFKSSILPKTNHQIIYVPRIQTLNWPHFERLGWVRIW